MAAGLLVLVSLVILLLLVVPLVTALLAWVVLRPADDEPVARARLRRASGTTAATATSVAVVVVLPSAALALGSPELAAPAFLLAGLLHVAVLWTGEALTARPHAARRTALLGAEPRPPLHTALVALVVGSLSGLLLLLAVALLSWRPDVLQVPPNATLLTVVPAVVLTGMVLLASRQVGRRPSDSQLHPEVDASARARALHRLLRTGAAGTCAALGLVLAGIQMREAASAGDAVATAALVLGGLLVVVAAVVSVLPPPALLLRPDQAPATTAPETGLSAGAA